MAALGSLFVVVLLVGTLLLPMFLIRGARKNHLRKLNALAGEALGRMTARLFDAPPAIGAFGLVAGRRGGEAVEIRAEYTDLGYVGTGHETRIGTDITVTVGLRGATPRLSLRPKDKLASYFTDRFEVTASPDAAAILDDETKQALMDWIVLVPSAKQIAVTSQGLTIRIPSSLENVADIERTVQMAERLKTRTLAVMDKQAHVRVASDSTDAAYRIAGAEPLVDAADEDAAPRTSR